MLILEQFEDTTLYDAGLAVDIAESLLDTSNLGADDLNLYDLNTNGTEPVNELVIIDSQVVNPDVFITDQPGIEFYKVGVNEDINSIASKISSFSNLRSIHIISHGSEGQLELSGQIINSNTATNNIIFFDSIKESLGNNGDLLLYGCNVADQSGLDFINLVSQLTDADVAASEDLTGSEALGGDWDLEVNTGDIETESIDGTDFTGLLRTIRWNVGATGGIFNGHLADGNQQWEFRGGDPSIIQLYHVGNDVWARALDEGTVTVYFFESGGRGDAQQPEQHTFIFSFPNQSPKGQDQSISVLEDLDFQFSQSDFSTGFLDADGDTFAGIRIDSLPEGTLSLNGNTVSAGSSLNEADINNLVFRSPFNEFGESFTSFEFSVYDGTSYSYESYTMTLDVEGVNDAPIIIPGSAVETGIPGINETTDEDTSLTLNLTNYVFDVDGDDLNILDVSNTLHGSVTIGTGGEFIYTPDLNYFGSDLINMTISDGEFNLVIEVPLSVTPVNDAPTGQNQQSTVIEDTDYTFQISDFSNGYSDIENDPFSGIRIENLPQGSSTLNGNPISEGQVISVQEIPDLTYRAPQDQFGDNFSNFEYSLFDGTSYSSETYTMAIDVDGVNDAPVILSGSSADTGVASETETTDEDTALTLNLANFVFDVDGDILGLAESGTALNGSIIDNGDGTFIYIPEQDYFGNDNLSLIVTDGEFNLDVSIPLVINSVNDAPTGQNDDAIIHFNTATVIDVLANDSDIENDPLSVSRIISTSSGTAAIDGQTVIFTPSVNFTGIATVVYEVSDGQDTSTSTITINVQQPNDYVDTTWVKHESGYEENHSVLDKDSSIESNTESIGVTDGEYSIKEDGNAQSSFLKKTAGIEITDGEYSVATVNAKYLDLHPALSEAVTLQQMKSEIENLISQL